MTTHGTLTIEPEFFSGELRLYSVPFFFVREFIQNSVDAGATEIHIGFDNGVFTIRDNGCGMDRETLLGVYFTLGKSGRAAEGGSIGGFGRARIVTCFAQQEYVVRSADYIAKGRGATFAVEDATPIAGCEITVTLSPSFEINVLAQIEQLTYLSYLPHVTLTYNGDTIPFRGIPIPTLDSDTPAISPLPSCRYANRVFHRVGGLVQFYTDNYSITKLKGVEAFIVDIPPAVSRNMLSPSREAYTVGHGWPMSQRIETAMAAFHIPGETELAKAALRARNHGGLEDNVKVTKVTIAIAELWEQAVAKAIAAGIAAKVIPADHDPIYATVYKGNADTISDMAGAVFLNLSDKCFARLNVVFASSNTCGPDMESHFLAVALHEVAHYAESSHDEDYARALTKMIGYAIG